VNPATSGDVFLVVAVAVLLLRGASSIELARTNLPGRAAVVDLVEAA
jgi:hypothetical protein